MGHPPLSTSFPSFAAVARHYGGLDLDQHPFSFDDEPECAVLAQLLFDLQKKLGSGDLRILSDVTLAFRSDVLSCLRDEPERRSDGRSHVDEQIQKLVGPQLLAGGGEQRALITVIALVK